MGAQDDGRPFSGHWKSAMGGDYLAAIEFDGRTPTFTIAAARLIPLEVRKMDGDSRDGDTAKVRDKLILFFDPAQVSKGWVMNKTNAVCLAAMFGDVVGGWIGKRVTLCTEMVQVGPKKELGIRVVGSPDLTAPLKAKIELPRRRPVFRDLVPTGQQRGREPGEDG